MITLFKALAVVNIFANFNLLSSRNFKFYYPVNTQHNTSPDRPIVRSVLYERHLTIFPRVHWDEALNIFPVKDFTSSIIYTNNSASYD